MAYAIPMYESERGWGSKIDGYMGTYETLTEANIARDRYNKKYNSEEFVPNYYIAALEPVEYEEWMQLNYRKV